jgi:hypothetical protein
LTIWKFCVIILELWIVAIFFFFFMFIRSVALYIYFKYFYIYSCFVPIQSNSFRTRMICFRRLNSYLKAGPVWSSRWSLYTSKIVAKMSNSTTSISKELLYAGS